MNTDTHVEIKVNGKSVKQYRQEGNTYIEARAGTEYSIKINNDSWGRKLAVITVDGVNVISGQPQDEGVGEGYIVNARNSIEIKGFRKDTSTVGAFKFCKKGNSYCNEKGLRGNNGVIGIRIYAEKSLPIMFRSINTYDNNDVYGHKDTSGIPPYTGRPDIYCKSIMDSSLSTMKSNDPVQCCYTSSINTPYFDMGTTWGQKIDDSVKTVEFEHETYVHAEHIIYYDTRENLEKIGICFKEEKQVAFPKAFGAFAQPPKGWKGK